MKNLEVFKFGFDPDKCDLEVLKNRVSRIIWTCIKNNHLVDQYFNDDVLNVAKRIKTNNPSNYQEFKNIIRASPLNVFGRITVDEKVLFCQTEMDHEFWGRVWRYIKGRSKFRIEIQEKT